MGRASWFYCAADLQAAAEELHGASGFAALQVCRWLSGASGNRQ